MNSSTLGTLGCFLFLSVQTVFGQTVLGQTHATLPGLLAQKPAGLAEEGGGLLPLAIAVGVSILICFPGFMNPKRSHEKE
ncbi:MAG: hypothetical protein ACPGXK_13225 [Phycisphaerae bacterium]